MEDEIRKMFPPEGKRRHQYCRLERKGIELWVDLTVLRHCTRWGSVPVYTLDGDKLVFDHLERAGALHQEGVY